MALKIAATRLLTLVVAFFCLNGAIEFHCQDVRKVQARNVWRGLIPLHATRSDVEKLLGQPDRHDF
jgi:hypothetical protein